MKLQMSKSNGVRSGLMSREPSVQSSDGENVNSISSSRAGPSVVERPPFNVGLPRSFWLVASAAPLLGSQLMHTKRKNRIYRCFGTSTNLTTHSVSLENPRVDRLRYGLNWGWNSCHGCLPGHTNKILNSCEYF